MSFSMQKLRSLLPDRHANGRTSGSGNNSRQQSVDLEPEIGFQIAIETFERNATTTTMAATAATSTTVATVAAQKDNDGSAVVGGGDGAHHHHRQQQQQLRRAVPELSVHLLAARHLPALFGFKVVQGYMVKVKMFPGSQRLESSIQTNSWPKFDEYFRFPLAPDIKPSLKHYSSRRGTNKSLHKFTPDELFAGHFVVFTVYALLELPPTHLNRLSRTCRSLREKGTNLVQKVVDNSSGAQSRIKDGSNATTTTTNTTTTMTTNSKELSTKLIRNRPATMGGGGGGELNARDSMPPLTISESRRNIGSVTCYLESKIFQRNARTGVYATEELWLPIKDITTTTAAATTATTTMAKTTMNNMIASAKGVVEITLELQDVSEVDPTAMMNGTMGPPHSNGHHDSKMSSPWDRITAEMRRLKMGLQQGAGRRRGSQRGQCLVLRVTTSRMRCSNKVKDELEANAGTVYVKTAIFERDVYVTSWKSATFYPSLSTKWDTNGDGATLIVPLQSLDDVEQLTVRTTLATKTKVAKKVVLGTVTVALQAPGSGADHMRLLRDTAPGQRIAVWHSFQ